MTTRTRTAPRPARSPTGLARRLAPLHIAVFLHGFMLWPPVEKLFMTEIGFDPVAVGIMAAAYAALVPIIEIPSGILADRWSRRGVLVVASTALTLCALIGWLSHDLLTYALSALALGVFFAMYSGTMDAVVYDTVLEHNGVGDEFEHRIGRIRVAEAAALVTSSLLGGWVAGQAGPRLTYLLTVPVAAASIAAYLRFREPRLHKTAERTPLRHHLAATARAVTRGSRLLPIITLAVLGSVVLQLLLEFGPLWLVALAVPALLYGPYWAGLVSTLGLGALLAGRLRLGRPVPAIATALTMAAAAVVLTTRANLVVVASAQVVLALLVVAAGVHVTRLLHDGVPSTIRAGVASGVGAMSWIVFLPIALVFGLVSAAHGVQAAGHMLTSLAVVAGALLIGLAVRPASSTSPDQL